MNKEDNKFLEQTLARIKKEYGFNETISEIILEKAWQEGHAYGYNEVNLHIEELAEMVEKIIKAVNRIDYGEQ